MFGDIQIYPGLFMVLIIYTTALNDPQSSLDNRIVIPWRWKDRRSARVSRYLSLKTGVACGEGGVRLGDKARRLAQNRKSEEMAATSVK